MLNVNINTVNNICADLLNHVFSYEGKFNKSSKDDDEIRLLSGVSRVTDFMSN